MSIISAGTKFGLITVTGAPESRRNGVYYECQCDCGATLTVSATRLRRKAESGGGCQQCAKGRIGKHHHGSSRDATYSKYQAMKQRCCNPKHKSWKDYGGRGITVCERWQSFDNFLADMGACPGPAYTIDRKDSNGNYEPGNCKWSTRLEQNRNQRNNIKIVVDGTEYATLTLAAEAYGLPKQTVKARVRVYGWSVERALKEPVNEKFRKQS